MIKIIKRCTLCDSMDHSNYVDSINILKIMHQEVIQFIEIGLFNMTNQRFKIKILKHEIISSMSIKNHCLFFLNSLSFSDVNCLFFILLSFPFIDQVVDLLFGITGNIYNNYKNDLFTASKLYVIEKIMYIFINAYNSLYKEWTILCKKYFTYRTTLDFEFLKTVKITSYLQTVFSCEYKNFTSSFIINIPDLAFFTIQKKYQHYCHIKEKKIFSFNTNMELLKHIYHSKLNCIVRLDKFFVSSDYVLNLKLGNILHINKPNFITICTENNIPILNGKCYSDNKKYMMYVKTNFLNTNLNIKKNKL
ncbi:Flagellar motor switch protein FliM [Buchnera aphidicola (Takecallis arundicolens)]|uniref:hypothetical protein n=1 Tax=Buchnera aphidicola TaxID=9 RepID=UPI003464E4F6